MTTSKLLIVTPVAPPSPTGQSIILERLFESWSTKNYCFLVTQESSSSANEKATVPIYSLISKNKTQKQYIKKSSAFFSKIKKKLSNALTFVFLLKKILFIIKKEKISILICSTGDPLTFPASAIICKLKKIPLILYIFDDYIYQWPQPFIRKLAKLIEKPCVKLSSDIIVQNEFLAKIYHERYHIQPIVIHNKLSRKMTVATPKTFEMPGDIPIKIVYTGSIYYVHYDAFLNLTSYIKQSEKKIELHIYTAQDEIQLKGIGITHENIFYHNYLPQDQIQAKLKQADLLFLPLSFLDENTNIVMTSAPGKMAEYMASGVPVLAHTPRDCFVNWYCKNYACALIADELSLSSLKQAFSILYSNPELLLQITINAIERVKIDFSSDSIDEKFKQILLKIPKHD
ncbi:MAG: glycosyltransferase [Legionellales bacterium]|nr:glycosyltransferase [Legionellales bacterium]